MLESCFKHHARGTRNLLQISVQFRIGSAPVGTFAAVGFEVGNLEQQLRQMTGALTSDCGRKPGKFRQGSIVKPGW